MNGKCFEIGTIQAFLDGETSPDVTLRLTDHVAACDNCARVMAEADEENSAVFSTLERELNTLVPTQRLWSRINETIEVERGRVPAWQKVLAYARVTLLNPSIPVAAGILLLLGMFAVVITVRDGGTVPSTEVVSYTPPSRPVAAPQQDAPVVDVVGDEMAMPARGIKSDVKASDLNPREMKALAASVKAAQREIKPQNAIFSPAVDSYLPGEESYVKTISDLKQNVDLQKDAVMTPSSRISYERDMAVVNDSIKRMRDVVKKNPRNQAARQVLYSSYQDKIDLLNSVAQREELMAALQ